MSIELAVSSVILALRPSPVTAAATSPPLSLWVPLVRRIREPYLGMWALPGGPLHEECGLAEAARQSLRSTTGLDPRYLEQLYTFGGLERSRASASSQGGEAERVVSIVYWALVRPEEDAAVDASLIEAESANVAWFPADEPPTLAFDHAEILDYALARLRAKLTYSPIAHAFLPDSFTIAHLREVYEAVLGRELDPANFRRQALSGGNIEPTGETLTGTSHRPPRLYRYRASRIASSPTPSARSAS